MLICECSDTQRVSREAVKEVHFCHNIFGVRQPKRFSNQSRCTSGDVFHHFTLLHVKLVLKIVTYMLVR